MTMSEPEASISASEVAPARVMTKSASAYDRAKSDCERKSWQTTLGRLENFNRMEALSLPRTTSKSTPGIFFAVSKTASKTLVEPRLPPIANTLRFANAGASNRPQGMLGSSNCHDTTHSLPGKYFSASGNPRNTVLENFPTQRLDNPGIASDSWR